MGQSVGVCWWGVSFQFQRNWMLAWVRQRFRDETGMNKICIMLHLKETSRVQVARQLGSTVLLKVIRKIRFHFSSQNSFPFLHFHPTHVRSPWFPMVPHRLDTFWRKPISKGGNSVHSLVTTPYSFLLPLFFLPTLPFSPHLFTVYIPAGAKVTEHLLGYS